MPVLSADRISAPLTAPRCTTVNTVTSLSSHTTISSHPPTCTKANYAHIASTAIAVPTFMLTTLDAAAGTYFRPDSHLTQPPPHLRLTLHPLPQPAAVTIAVPPVFQWTNTSPNNLLQLTRMSAASASSPSPNGAPRLSPQHAAAFTSTPTATPLS